MLNKLIEEYRSSFKEKYALLESHIQDLQKEFDENKLQDLKRNVHKIAGSAGSYGFSALSKTCKEFENLLLQDLEAVKEKKTFVLNFEKYREFMVQIKSGMDLN